MVGCLVITRNGNGNAWKFMNLKAARLHPIPQFDDVYAITPDQLVEQYGRGLIDGLLRFSEGRDRARLVDALEQWRNSRDTLPVPIRELLWEKVCQSALTPPTDPTEIVKIIKEDRSFREGRILRSIGASERSSIEKVQRKENEDMSTGTRTRIAENSVITLLVEENPKRAGSKAHERFANYQSGMTVKEAKEAGLLATDIAYDQKHNYISLAPGAEAEVVEGEAEAEAPKKKSKKAAAQAAAA